jgi:hypothetical protein
VTIEEAHRGGRDPIADLAQHPADRFVNEIVLVGE